MNTISVVFLLHLQFRGQSLDEFFEAEIFLRQKVGFHFSSYVLKLILHFGYFVTLRVTRIPKFLHLSHLKALTWGGGGNFFGCRPCRSLCWC